MIPIFLNFMKTIFWNFFVLRFCVHAKIQKNICSNICILEYYAKEIIENFVVLWESIGPNVLLKRFGRGFGGGVHRRNTTDSKFPLCVISQQQAYKMDKNINNIMEE
jgi:hypothetical protein